MKAHGIKGQLKVRLQTYLPERYLNQEILWLQSPTSTQLSSYEAEAFYETMPGFALLSLKSICDRSAAELLSRYELHIPRSREGTATGLVEGLDECVGYQLLSSEEPIGTLTEVHLLPQNPLLSMWDKKGRTHLIPAQSDFITKVDHSTRCIYVKLPEGLLELR